MRVACSSRKASPQALATASGSGLSCVRTSARRCVRATVRSLRRRKRTAESGSGGSGRCGCGEGWPMEERTLLGGSALRNATTSLSFRSRRALAQLPQPGEVRAVPLWRDLQIARNLAEPGVVDQTPEGDRANLAL